MKVYKLKTKIITFPLLFMLGIVIAIISCDSSGAIFGNLESKSNTEQPAAAAVPEKNNKETYKSKNVSNLIYVPEGVFYPAEGFGKMTVSSFHIGKYEITRAEYYKIMGEKPWLIKAYGAYPLSDIYEEEEEIERNPATGMSWFEAIVFCNKLSIKENLTPVYTLPGKGTNPDDWGAVPAAYSKEADKEAGTVGNDSNNPEKNIQEDPLYLWNRIEADWSANGYRLPSAMEFIWAALGAADTQNRRFSGDNGKNKIKSYAWYFVNGEKNTHPAGEKKPNILGLFDMTGNVMEWCWDITGIYEEISGGAGQDGTLEPPQSETNPETKPESTPEPKPKNVIIPINLPKEDSTDYRGGKLPAAVKLPDAGKLSDTGKPLNPPLIQRAVLGGSWETDEEKSSLIYKDGLFFENRFSDERDTKRLGFRVVRQ